MTQATLLAFTAILSLIMPVAAQEQCVDPASLTTSTVSIIRYLTTEERQQTHATENYGATAWFYQNKKRLVTVEHFIEGPRLPIGEWREVFLKQTAPDGKSRVVRMKAKLVEVVRSYHRGLAIFELESPFPGATALQLRESPLGKGEAVRAIGYPDSKLRFAAGTFHRISSGEDEDRIIPQGLSLFELWDVKSKEDRLVLDSGASGGPIVDCEGRVVAVTNEIIIRDRWGFAGRTFRILDPWGNPTMTGVGIEQLFSLKLSD